MVSEPHGSRVDPADLLAQPDAAPGPGPPALRAWLNVSGSECDATPDISPLLITVRGWNGKLT